MTTFKKGQTVHSQARTIVKRVIEKCEEETLKGELLHALYKPNIRAAEYTGLSRSTVNKIKNETFDSEGTVVSTPAKKKRKTAEHEFRCSEKDKMLIRNTIYNIYKRGKVVTCGPKLLKEIREQMNFPWDVGILRKLLKSMGYEWKKYNTWKRILIERPRIVAWRGNYLKAVQSHRMENRNIIYIDEIWVDNTLNFGKYWQSEEEFGASKNTSSSERIIIVHAGGQNGFVPNAGLIFKTDSATSDYYGQMDAVNFESWIVELLVPNIPPNTVVVMDNAPYHSTEMNKAPHKYAKREDMLSWLEQNNLPHKEKMKKYELAELISRHKPAKRIYKVDEILKSYGHSILRLPPNMRELNPIEQAWVKIKQTISENNIISTLTLDELQSLLPETIDSVMASDWAEFCKHTEQLEKEFMDKDSLLEVAMENVTLNNLGSENDDGSSSDDF
ncbi:uncharacterized protein LOC143174156 isoform X1 [Nomia melanderi]|uniref:uncharacterized protein LOC143174156 isoform X1 n=1 Tax=Nomia melanderi TaxID=2448451 RepID=UPI0013045BAB|nr:uncharacterized protein LOC116428586 isoform X3 [Nomia melanderi]XP_031836249.1 uncharacterized protein LOC116428586 isoform X3 [Nomia melanderi]XP_031836252.1 uncharacterized protein LOC116428586 isoform X3 [Nomia melanderi]XP_031836253.1 uncharacterized protein LOC116428586 isoform X3 [Nomia melanderi]XP_031836254.1 uncharacterized protein LOC116428586 isoform X3 [Nomia melanderi]XP_031836255.1 uncharacterized protein LOC116428586 isoform X3 [Nomia melanderi]XP_031836256.1 uncharacterize